RRSRRCEAALWAAVVAAAGLPASCWTSNLYDPDWNWAAPPAEHVPARQFLPLESASTPEDVGPCQGPVHRSDIPMARKNRHLRAHDPVFAGLRGILRPRRRRPP